MKALNRLLEIMSQLRDPKGGCPWDLEQTHKSLAKYTLEEAYEVLDAIESQDMNQLKVELGDLLLQVVFHAQLANEKKNFSMEDIVLSLNEKLIHRHPHVFGDKKNLNSQQVQNQWEDIKKQEKKDQGLLDSVPKVFPALLKAHTIGKKCASVGFDWETLEDIKTKMDEEWEELRLAQANLDDENIEEEAGDYLFVFVQYIRKLGLEAESVLQKANQKFTKRLQGVEKLAKQQGKSMSDCSNDELESFWQQVKKMS